MPRGTGLVPLRRVLDRLIDAPRGVVLVEMPHDVVNLLKRRLTVHLVVASQDIPAVGRDGWQRFGLRQGLLRVVLNIRDGDGWVLILGLRGRRLLLLRAGRKRRWRRGIAGRRQPKPLRFRRGLRRRWRRGWRRRSRRCVPRRREALPRR